MGSPILPVVGGPVLPVVGGPVLPVLGCPITRIFPYFEHSRTDTRFSARVI